MLTPTRTADILPECKELLSVADINSALGGADRTFVAEGDELTIDFPTPDSNGFAGRIVLMDTINGAGGQTEYPDKVRGYKFKARVDILPIESPEYNTKLVAEYIHHLIYMKLHGQKLTLAHADQVYKLKRLTETTPLFATEQGWKYMSATYLTILAPKP
jgi:hypothetical protein